MVESAAQVAGHVRSLARLVPRPRGGAWTLPLLGWLTMVNCYYSRPTPAPPCRVHPSRLNTVRGKRISRQSVAKTSARCDHRCARGCTDHSRGSRLRRWPTADHQQLGADVHSESSGRFLADADSYPHEVPLNVSDSQSAGPLPE